MEVPMTARSVVLSALAAAALAAGACNDASSGRTRFRAALSGAEEVPARAVPATGQASITLDGDIVFFTIGVQQINQVVAAHIHSGAPGVNGPVRVDLFTGP